MHSNKQTKRIKDQCESKALSFIERYKSIRSGIRSANFKMAKRSIRFIKDLKSMWVIRIKTI